MFLRTKSTENSRRTLRLTLASVVLAMAGLACLFLPAGQTDTPAPPTATPAESATSPSPTGQFPAAGIVNDEGGPAVITGEVSYTNPFFTTGVAEPLILLEDEGGFVTRDRGFVFPPESQVLGQITSDFFTSPFSYSLELPVEPRGTLNDVDNDGQTDTGVMVYAIAYWTNTWGDPYLEQRDQGGGGWSSAYASTRVSDHPADYLEIYGGKLLIYAPDANQGFPSSFGDDGRLFTDDDPIVGLPAGWTLVDLDQDPFVFDRSRQPQVELYEPPSSALDDFSDLSYTEAFDAMLEKFRTEYAFTEYKHIDWDALGAQYRPAFVDADQMHDPQAYGLALRDFLWSIPDGHIGMNLDLIADQFRYEVQGGLGMSLVQLSDQRILVGFLTSGGPAETAGIQFGAEIQQIDGVPAADYVANVQPWSAPFSTETARRLQQLLYSTRFPVGTDVQIRYQNPGGQPADVTLTTEFELDSYFFQPPGSELTGFELPVEFRVLDSGVGYVQIFSFFDNELLTIQIWERMMRELNDQGVDRLIIDLRQNGGGSGYLAQQMAAYFFDDQVVTGNTGRYDPTINDFFFDPTEQSHMIPPPADLRYHGQVVTILGTNCASACEFFAFDMTLQDRARSTGIYGTAGLGGSVEDFDMPEDVTVRMTIGRAVGPDGNIHIEGKGVTPDVPVPLDEQSFLSIYRDGADVELQQAQVMLGAVSSSGFILTRSLQTH